MKLSGIPPSVNPVGYNRTLLPVDVELIFTGVSDAVAQAVRLVSILTP